MRRLILFRHGKAALAGLTGGDRERPLAQRGRAEAAMAAQWLLVAGFVPQLALVSPALRTRETWDCVSQSFPGARGEVRDGLYLAGAEAIMDLLQDAPADTDTVMVVGHNPGLQELGVKLATDGGAPHVHVARMAEGFPTASACVFRMRDASGPVLEAAYQPPKRPSEAPRWAFFGANAGETD